MSSPLLRSIAAILAGLLAAAVVVVAVEGLGAIAHPFPSGADTSDPEVVKAHVAKCPAWVLAVVVIAWGGTVFLGTWLATRLGTDRRPFHGFTVGTLLIVALGLNLSMLPYPLWFEFTTVIGFVSAVHWAVKVGRAPSR